jgi:hypothetical protein
MLRKKNIDNINANGDVNENGNAHEEFMEDHIFVATGLVEE